MAVLSFDAVSGAHGGSETSDSTTHTPVGTPSLAVLLMWTAAATGSFAATYGGDSMAALTGSPHAGPPRGYGNSKLDPSSGAQTVAVSWTTSTRHGWGVWTFLNALFIPEFLGDDGVGAAQSTLTFPNTSSKGFIVELFGVNDNTAAVAEQSGQTQDFSLGASGIPRLVQGFHVAASNGSTDVRVDTDTGTWVHIAAYIPPAPPGNRAYIIGSWIWEQLQERTGLLAPRGMGELWRPPAPQILTPSARQVEALAA